MDRHDHIAHVRADTDLLLAAAADRLDSPVPTCPGWTCERLVGHIGRVHRSVAGWATTGTPPEVERPPAGDAVVDWTRAGVDELMAALSGLDPEGPVTTWAGDQPSAFWPRRMAVETALHRYDAQAAAGPDATTPIATALAIDAVDELFDVVLPWRGVQFDGAGETIHLHATDDGIDAHEGGEWLVTLGSDGLGVERAHAKGDVAVRGAASDLLLLLWNRVGPETCQVFGDTDLLDRWRASVTL